MKVVISLNNINIVIVIKNIIKYKPTLHYNLSCLIKVICYF